MSDTDWATICATVFTWLTGLPTQWVIRGLVRDWQNPVGVDSGGMRLAYVTGDDIEGTHWYEAVPDYYHDEVASAGLLRELTARVDEQGQRIYYNVSLEWNVDPGHGWVAILWPFKGNIVTGPWSPDFRHAILLAAHQAAISEVKE